MKGEHSAGPVLVAAFALVCSGAMGAALLQAQQASAASAKASNGIQKVGKSYYVYKKGKLLKKNGKVGKTWYAVTSKGKLRGYKKGNWCHYADGGYMSYQDSLDFKALVRADGIVKKITRASDSKATKRYKAFRWVMGKSYKMHRRWDYHRVSWPAVYAFDHFDNKGGDCHSDASAFAYLAAAIGYQTIDVCIDSGPRAHQSHCWTMLDHNRIFDPLFASRSFSKYYNSTGGSYEVNPLHRIKICQFEKKHGKPVLPKKIKNEWVKIGGFWYYKLGNGKNAVGSVKNRATSANFTKGAYYVFSAKGRLLKGKGTRVVKVKGTRYQVAKSGKAKPGWNAAKTGYFTKKGTVVTGFRAIGGKLYRFSDKGVLDAGASTALKPLCKEGADYAQLAAELKGLGAKAKSSVSQRSCDTYKGEAGDNVIYRYKGFTVLTFKADGGAEYVMSVE